MGMQSALMQMTPPMTRFETASSIGGCGGTMSTRTNSPIPRPSSCASGSYGSPRVGEGYRSSPKPHSSPKMKLRFYIFMDIVLYSLLFLVYMILTIFCHK